MRAKQQCFRWMQTARRLSWLLAMLLILNQSMVLFDSIAETGSPLDSCSLEIATLPSAPSDYTLSKPDDRTPVPATVRVTATLERPFLAGAGALPVSRPVGAPSGAIPPFHKTVSHLRV